MEEIIQTARFVSNFGDLGGAIGEIIFGPLAYYTLGAGVAVASSIYAAHYVGSRAVRRFVGKGKPHRLEDYD